MERIRIKNNSKMKDIIHQGLKSTGYDILYQDIIKHQLIIYKNRQHHMAAIFISSNGEHEYILVDYFKTHETNKLANEFARKRIPEFVKVSELILNLKSIL